MGTDVERRNHLAGSVVHRDGDRTQTLLQFLIDDAPPLLTHFLQALEQCFGGMDGSTGLGLQVGVVEILVQ
ncbi:hypothetical protein D3C75_1139420 [compost metagenome]